MTTQTANPPTLLRLFSPNKTFMGRCFHNGNTHFLPETKLPEESLYAVACFHQLLALDPPDLGQGLTEEQKQAILAKVKAYIQSKGLK
jgi:hypothetical protein